jgi:mediator of replication checkpoint protein 1
LEVSENVRRQADSIFEKEQVYVLEAARQKPAPKETLYVNDHG